MTTTNKTIPITRRRIDQLLIGVGGVAAIVMLVAGTLLTWGNNFANDYVEKELTAQNIAFPPADALQEEGRDDLIKYAGKQVATGTHAEAYASYIQGHVENIADGETYATLGEAERETRALVEEARQNNATTEEIATLEENAATITIQRESIFKGELLRGTLLNAYAWSTMGEIAGIAATVAYIGAILLTLLLAAGLIHMKKQKT